jgi:glycine/D-amino acid oxidase-like deaminating enzyme
MGIEAGIAIVGGGVIGLATALRLAGDGHHVVVVDAQTGAVPTSIGNAGTIAAYNCVPVGTPNVLRGLPHLLLDADSPFAMRWAALPALAPWLIRFARECLPARARVNAAALASLLHDALADWNDVADAIGAADLIRRNGALYVFPDAAALAADRWAWERRAAGGVRQMTVAPAEIAQLEPSLTGVQGHGVFFPDAAHIVDPQDMLRRLHDSAAAAGVQFQSGRIAVLRREAAGIRLAGPDLAITAERVVIAAGAWSRPLAFQAGDVIPLETERGYHAEYPSNGSSLSRPVCPVQFGVYLTPMAGRLRAAGTVELGGLVRPPDPRRSALLDRAARSLLPDLPPPSGYWMGFRPSIPDSLPVIGRSSADPRILYAFGHGHLGLTLAAVTARHVATLLRSHEPVNALKSFSPGRFAK